MAKKRSRGSRTKPKKEIAAAEELTADSGIEQPQAEAMGLTPVQAPMFYASVLQIQAVGTDFNLIFLRARPVAEPGQPVSQRVAMQEVVAIFQVSAHTLKDISLILPPLIKKYEKLNGELKTPFMRRRDVEKVAAAKSPSSRRH